jgi:hypothetical protein
MTTQDPLVGSLPSAETKSNAVSASSGVEIESDDSSEDDGLPEVATEADKAPRFSPLGQLLADLLRFRHKVMSDVSAPSKKILRLQQDRGTLQVCSPFCRIPFEEID